MDWLNQLEGAFLLFLQNEVRSPILDQIMRLITILGERGLIPIFICVALLFIERDSKGRLCFRGGTKTGVIAAVALLMDAILINVWLKNAVERIRPYEVIEGLHYITTMPHDFSFPSGHTGSCFAIACVLFIRMPRKVGITALAIAGMVGFSRLYLGIHYPTDVLAGMGIGIFCGYAANWICLKLAERLTARS